MYNPIPPGGTGIILAATGITVGWMTGLFYICAIFALIGAILAIKRILPVPKFLQKRRAQKIAKKLTT